MKYPSADSYDAARVDRYFSITPFLPSSPISSGLELQAPSPVNSLALPSATGVGLSSGSNMPMRTLISALAGLPMPPSALLPTLPPACLTIHELAVRARGSPSQVQGGSQLLSHLK
ncbi:hypothetical protein QYF36_015764 [Acer negundo]|nr:hypothetical protein QYF36_015764 [Acer negundo]